MKNHIKITALVAGLCMIAISAAAQTPIKRTVYKSETVDFGPGGTLAIAGAPAGSVRVDGWDKPLVEINAEIEISGRTEAELDELSKVTGVVIEDSMGRVSVNSLGTNDKAYLKRVAKKFPKELIGLPYKIDYVVKVPRYCDLTIDGGKGDLQISGIDGTIKINFLESRARLDMVGGALFATFGSGSVEVNVPSRSWRGRFADVSLASGTMKVSLPPSLNAEVDAVILRTGKIDNTFTELKPKTRKDTFTETLIAARSGNGGVPLKFTVGDGSLTIAEFKKP